MSTKAARSPAGRSKPERPAKHGKTELRQQKRKRDQEEVEALQQRVEGLDLKSDSFTRFADLPLSEPTASGIKASHFTSLTDIQAQAIPTALKGKDILGAARTGSGKTLAFLVPMLERLYRARWTEYDGLGALIISPTRELAVQIFEVLRKIGRNHVFSAGLVIGGKSLKEEAERLPRMNILVCTPGRMLQHLDQTVGFNADNLQILVLDEADRIMDMGFQSAVDALVEHLPRTRQTLMFSATQSKRVSDLARLSLHEPEYISVHEAAAHSTPSNLQQHYIVTPLHEKLDTLFGFVKANLKSKMIVFLSSGKQVRFVYESFRHLQPGIPLLHLHGRQKQGARLGVTSNFRSATHSCLFATDVVARGIDFPAVDWVIQVDCPEDADTYIHRVGRTARYESNGRAVLFLDPSEEAGMVAKLEQKRIPIQKVNVKEKKKRSITNHLQNMCFQNPDLKYLGQKAFISYVRAIHLQRDKSVFDMSKLDLDAFSASLGLPGTPQIRFQKGEDIKKIKNAQRQGMSSGSESEMDMDGAKPSSKTKKNAVRTKYDKMFERTNQDVLSEHYSKLVGKEDEKADNGDGNGDDSEEDFLSVKRRLNDDDLDEESKKAPASGAIKVVDGLVIDSKRREKALRSKKKMAKFKGGGSKLIFDDDGNAHAIYELTNEDDFAGQGPADELRRRFIEEEAARVKEADADDKMAAKQRRREKKERRKEREAAEAAGMYGPGDDGGDDVADLGGIPAIDDDQLDFIRSLPIAGQGGGDASDRDGDDEPPRKKKKKWFQQDEDDDDDGDNDINNAKPKKKGKPGAKVFEVDEEPQTLEDLEALATGLLNG
ncbi:ATP-dependent RNA helicase DDX10/DBP4 [Geosmithia morbida]|uniref:ATP-dependent RNA helicase n=1 Tax=Geosmithia morbida TaxID=1094350 RepID=A0A9P4YXW9_9HYPO|nr:ATP-dependent RNA helicase DDX10/DBP4 [Geosmithia morbida]KAF4123029.1 ATP-dependent RNA helicase DDX10/DBP4 [Geosmithia morbida]